MRKKRKGRNKRVAKFVLFLLPEYTNIKQDKRRCKSQKSFSLGTYLQQHTYWHAWRKGLWVLQIKSISRGQKKNFKTEVMNTIQSLVVICTLKSTPHKERFKIHFLPWNSVFWDPLPPDLAQWGCWPLGRKWQHSLFFFSYFSACSR